MTAKLNRSFIITLIIALLYFSNTLCQQETKATSVQPTKTNIITTTEVHKIFVPNILDKDRNRFSNFKNIGDESEFKKIVEEKVEEKKKEMRKNRDDRKYSKHEDRIHNNDRDDNDDDDDDDDDKDKKKHKSTPSNTVVTTIIIVATETPTEIYTGNVNPAKQKGTGDSGHQVSDPNSSSDDDDNDEDESSETALTDQLYKDQSSYRKLVLALSIVGGVAGVALITSLLIFTRMKIRKRKRKQTDLENAEPSNNNSPPSPPSPPSHYYSPPLPPPKARYSTMSDDGDSTVIDFSQNPFLDPSTTLVGNKTIENNNTVAVLPNAPPSLPVHLEHRQYSDYRQNRTLSMISQSAGATLPSAPTAKELDGISRYENPFEDEYGSSQQHYTVLDENENAIRDSPISSPSMRLLSSSLRTSNTSSYSSDLPPPPAYTPSAAPSAPPLYALPASREFITQQPPEDDSSRRHSISSCSMISTNRPLSLRRGSGSPAHISSPFS